MSCRYENPKKASPGEVYTQRLGRILKDHRRFRNVTRKAVQGKLIKKLNEHEHDPDWNAFRDLVDPHRGRGGSVIRLEDHGLSNEIISLPDLQLLADVYGIPELMLDPARSEPVDNLISVYKPEDFRKLEQEDVPFYGDGAQYYVPKKQIHGTENVAIVLLKLEGRPRASECVISGIDASEDDVSKDKLVPAHSDSHSHPGEELVFLKRKGSIEMRFGGSGLYSRLGKGHLIHFDAPLDHSAWNLWSEESECFIIRFYRQKSILHPNAKTAQRKFRINVSPSKQDDSEKRREVTDRHAFGQFLMLLCSEKLRGTGRGLSLSGLAKRAKERKYKFYRSKLDRIHRGQTPVFESDLPKLAEIYDVEPMALYDFLLPVFHSAIAIHGQNDMDEIKVDLLPVDEIKADFLPVGVTYWLPRRRLAFSETMIAILTLDQGSATKPNRHPGQEILIVLEGKVKLHLGAKHHVIDKGYCAHYSSDNIHSVQNVGDELAKMLCIKIIC